MADAVLGIDFGTSNTAAAMSRAGAVPEVLTFDGHRSLPSAVYLQDDGSLVVGRDAERLARLAPERFEPNPKRRIDDVELLLGIDVISVQTAIAAVLRRVADTAAAALQGRTPTRVNLTHPADWGTSRRRLLSAAARDAGLGNVTLIPEPIAAATHFGTISGRALPAGSSLAVYDLGGGTFDCAVVEATETGYLVLAEGGLPDVGGVDFDQSVLEHLGRTMSRIDSYHWQSLAVPQTAASRRDSRRLREDIRGAKEALSRAAQTDVPLPDPFPDALLTRGEVEGLIRPAIIRTVTQLQRTLRTAERESGQLAGIYLVGGSSRIPLVAAVIAERVGVVPVSLEEPETTVALGAALAREVTTNKSRPRPAGSPGGAPVDPPGGPAPSWVPRSGPAAGTGADRGSTTGMTPIAPTPESLVRGLPSTLSGPDPATMPRPPGADRPGPPAGGPPEPTGRTDPSARPGHPIPSGHPGTPDPIGLPGRPRTGVDGPITAVPSSAELRAAAAAPAAAQALPTASAGDRQAANRFAGPAGGPAPGPDRRPVAGESEALATARASVGRLMAGSPGPRRRSRRGWWVALVVVAVLAAVVVEIVVMTRDRPDAAGPAGSGAASSVGTSTDPADCPAPTGNADEPGGCLQEATANARSGAIELAAVSGDVVDPASRAMIAEAGPVDQVTLSGRADGSGPMLMVTFVQLADPAARDELFGRMVEDLDGQPHSYGDGKWSGRMVQAMADGQPRVVCMLDTMPIVIAFSPAADTGPDGTLSVDELVDIFLDEVGP